MRTRSILIPAALAASLAAQDTNPLAGKPDAIAAGKKLYQASCQSCHGGDARGARGPALATGRFEHGGDDGQLYQTIRFGIAGTQMPGFGLTPDEIWQLVAYLRSLSGTVAEERVRGDAVAGAMVFAGKGACLVCHEVNGQGGRVGPELSGAGRWAAQSLREVVLDPNKVEGRTPDVVVAKTREGREIRGVRRNEDTFSVQLMDTAGEHHLLEKKNLVEVRYENKSLMPDDYGKRLTPGEIDNLIAYLKTLKGRDIARAASAPRPGGGLSWERIKNSHLEPHNWLTYWGDYQGRHFSALKQITTANVGSLQARWALQFPGEGVLQATPLVVDGIMYTTGPLGQVFALDARSGRQLWKFQRRLKVVNPYDGAKVNRGVALLGDRLFVTTIDAFVVALDARTGRQLWETQMANMKDGYSATMAPLALKDRIIAGISGAEFGIRGFIDSYDPATGKRQWRFHTIPGPGEFGSQSWAGDSWKQGGGSTWLTGTYDADLDLIYWGVGNPGPDLNGDVRMGDNLFSCSVVALEASTGRRRWHFQFTPHDTHDWDSSETPVLVDRMFRGQKRKLLLHADRNAFFYVLDRTTGKFELGKPFARQTWAKGLDDSGRPILMPNQEPTPAGNVTYPSLWGATNWMAPTYDPATGWMYITFREFGDRYYKAPAEYEAGKQYWGGKTVPVEEREWGGIKAINPETGNIEWEQKFHLGSLSAGVLGTAGGVVFAASREGNLMAFDSKSGKVLWRFQTGAQIDSSPMSYAVDGKQYVALAAGQVLYAFALPE